jgi:DNA-binding response OmpR family regulator
MWRFSRTSEPARAMSSSRSNGSASRASRSADASSSARLTPIVLVTALQNRANKIRGIEAGADDC